MPFCKFCIFRDGHIVGDIVFYKHTFLVVFRILGPGVQSVVSLMSSLRVISLTVLADSIYNILILFAEKMLVAFAATHIFSAKNFSIFAYHLM